MYCRAGRVQGSHFPPGGTHHIIWKQQGLVFNLVFFTNGTDTYLPTQIVVASTGPEF